MTQRKLHPEPHGEERFRAILAVSLRLFSRYGYEKTSLDRIAKEMKATKGLIYYYFRSKEDILDAMLKAYDFSTAIGAIGQIEASVPIGEALATITRGSMRLLDEHLEYVRFLYSEGQFIGNHSQRLLRAILDRWASALAAFLAERARKRELRPHDTNMSAHQLTDITLAYFLKTRVIHPHLAAELKGKDYFGAWIDMFLHGLSPRGVSAPPVSPSRVAAILRNAEGLSHEVLVSLAPLLFDPEEARSLQATVHLRFPDPTAADYAVRIDAGALHIAKAAPDAADLVLDMAANDLIAIARGEARAAQLYLEERIRLQGSVDLARRVGRCFSAAKAPRNPNKI